MWMTHLVRGSPNDVNRSSSFLDNSLFWLKITPKTRKRFAKSLSGLKFSFSDFFSTFPESFMVTSKHKTCLVQSRYRQKISIRYEVSRYWPYSRPINKMLRLGISDSSFELTCHGRQSVEQIWLVLLKCSTETSRIAPIKRHTRPFWPSSINPNHNRVQKITKISEYEKIDFCPFPFLNTDFQLSRWQFSRTTLTIP